MSKTTKIIASSSYFPETVVKNEEIEKVLNLEEGTIYSKTGIKERRIFTNENPLEIYSHLALETLNKAGLKSIDSLVIGIDLAERNVLDISKKVLDNLKDNEIFKGKEYSITHHCPGAVYSINKEAKKIGEEKIDNSLILSISKLYDLFDKENRGSSILWGDGGGAILLGSSNEEGLISSAEKISPELKYIPVINHSGKLSCLMNGKAVTRYVLENIPEVMNESLEKANLTKEDIDMFFFHQANGKILDFLIKRMGIPQEKVPKNIEKYGNTGISSVLINYDENFEKIKNGTNFMMVGFGKEVYGEGMQTNVSIFKK